MSPYDSKVLYAGSNELWRSIDRGQTWVTLGDRTTAVDRLTLRVMTQLPSESTLSLDDGVPFYPTMTAIAESPLRRRVLWVGTADGNLQISRDGGRTWLTIANRLPNLPKASYVSSIELSRHAENTVYVAFDNHRSDDNGNYLYRTTDGGATWTAIDSDLPLDRVIRVVREDPKNPNVLYLGTEMGALRLGRSGPALGRARVEPAARLDQRSGRPSARQRPRRRDARARDLDPRQCDGDSGARAARCSAKTPGSSRSKPPTRSVAIRASSSTTT